MERRNYVKENYANESDDAVDNKLLILGITVVVVVIGSMFVALS